MIMIDELEQYLNNKTDKYDGYTYPIKKMPSKRHDRVTEYVYKCLKCGKELPGYHMKRIKGHCYCGNCRKEINKMENKEWKEKSDMVNHPSHYEGKYECIEEMIDLLDRDSVGYFCYGNVFKYIWRCWGKNGFEDIKKAKWYTDKACELYCVTPFKNLDDIKNRYDKMLDAFGWRKTVIYISGEIFNILNTEEFLMPPEENYSYTYVKTNLSIIKPLLDYAVFIMEV